MGSKPGVDTHPAPGLEPQLARVTLLNEIFIVLNLGSVKHQILNVQNGYLAKYNESVSKKSQFTLLLEVSNQKITSG